LLGISVLADDYHLRVDAKLNETATFLVEGFLNGHKLVAKQARRIEKLERTVTKLQSIIAKLQLQSDDKQKVQRKSDRTRADKTDGRLFLSLLFASLPDEIAKKEQRLKLKNGKKADLVKKAVDAVVDMGWTIDEDTVSQRLKDTQELWQDIKT
jgi:hypothetical protein